MPALCTFDTSFTHLSFFQTDHEIFSKAILSLPLVESYRWKKNVHLILVNHLVGLSLPRKGVVRFKWPSRHDHSCLPWMLNKITTQPLWPKESLSLTNNHLFIQISICYMRITYPHINIILTLHFFYPKYAIMNHVLKRFVCTNRNTLSKSPDHLQAERLGLPDVRCGQDLHPNW